MFKSKPLLMLITGLVLALVLWGIVQAMQNGPAPADITTTENNTDTPIKETISGQYTNAPASILSAVQSGLDFTLKGTGVAGAGISLRSETKELVRTKVSGQGNWTLAFTTDAGSSSLVLDLLMVTPDGHQIRSDQSLFVIRNPHSLEVTEDIQIDRKALLLLTAPGTHSRVLQSPYGGLPQRSGFALEAIDYDNSGGVIFSGRSEQSGKVRIYAGENLVGESHVDSQGRWSLIFGNIMPLGEYKISAELVVTDGETIRLTLPFARMRPLFEAENSPKILVEHLDDRIQIGRALFGGGYQYSVIYAPIALVE
ncbi:MAG: hypothetical protein L3J65_05400 [Robiginitomaculum sp.]|nr:hypothetical protein [Robiginitomaculum sp.]